MSQPLPATIHSLMLDLGAGLRSVLGHRLVGLYLGGSLSLGDYCEASSDLDFLAVTDGILSPEDMLAVGMLHSELRERHKMAQRLEGDYAPRGFIVPDGTTEPVPGCEHGVFLPKVGEIMLTADHIYNMRENGLVFEGPEPWKVLPAVSAEQVRAAVRAMLKEGPGTCDTPEDAAREVLSLFRSLYALELGRPTSKSEGVNWARTHLETEWHPLVDSAVAVRWRQRAPGMVENFCQKARELSRTLLSRYV